MLNKEKRGNPAIFSNMILLRTITFSNRKMNKRVYRADEHYIYDRGMSGYENGK